MFISNQAMKSHSSNHASCSKHTILILSYLSYYCMIDERVTKHLNPEGFNCPVFPLTTKNRLN